MKKVLIAGGLSLLASACAVRAVPGGGPPPQGTVTLSIVGTNDLHGGVRARDGGAVLLIDAGDIFQGTLESNTSEGSSVVAAYNALG